MKQLFFHTLVVFVLAILLMYAMDSIAETRFTDERARLESTTVNDVLFTLLHRAYPDCEYKIKDGEKIEFEHLINVTETLECAATLQALEAELVKYKSERLADIEYREILTDKKITAKSTYDAVKDLYHSAAKKAGLTHISNPAAWFRDNCNNVNTHELIDSCNAKLALVQAKVSDVQADIQAVNDADNLCKNYKETIKNATLQQFAGLTDNQRWERVFNALKCISEGK